MVLGIRSSVSWCYLSDLCITILFFLLFLSDSQFNYSRMSVILPVFVTNLAAFFAPLMAYSMIIPDRASSIYQDWTYVLVSPLLAAFVTFLGQKINVRLNNAMVLLITDLCIPFQIIRNCYTEVFYVFKNCTL